MPALTNNSQLLLLFPWPPKLPHPLNIADCGNSQPLLYSQFVGAPAAVAILLYWLVAGEIRKRACNNNNFGVQNNRRK